jgi:hypothetical protein
MNILKFVGFKRTIRKFVNKVSAYIEYVYLKHFFRVNVPLKGQSHEKVDESRVWGVSLGPN